MNVILYLYAHKRSYTYTNKQLFYLGDPGVGAAAVSSGGIHPPSTFRKQQCQMRICPTGTFLPEGTLLVLDTPATFKPWVGLQAHATAVSQCSALVQVCCKEIREEKKDEHFSHLLIFSCNAIKKENDTKSKFVCLFYNYNGSLFIIHSLWSPES